MKPNTNPLPCEDEAARSRICTGKNKQTISRTLIIRRLWNELSSITYRKTCRSFSCQAKCLRYLPLKPNIKSKSCETEKPRITETGDTHHGLWTQTLENIKKIFDFIIKHILLFSTFPLCLHFEVVSNGGV
jgi:hypothetical protein